jgi:hypothetical protein
MRGIAALARLVAKEATRNAFFFLLLLVLAGWITLLPLLLNFTFSSAETMVRDAALSLLLVAGLVETVREGAARTAEERESARTEELFAAGMTPFAWAAGRWLGGLAATARLVAAGTAATALAAYAARGGISVRKTPVLLAAAAWAVALLFAAHRAGRTREPFPAVATRALERAFLLAALAGCALRFREGAELARMLLPAAALVFCACAAARGLAVFWGTVARPAAAAAVSALFLAGGLVAASFFAGDGAGPAAKAAYALFPDLQAFFLLDALAEGTAVPAGYLALAALYAALHAAAWLALAAGAVRLGEEGRAGR